MRATLCRLRPQATGDGVALLRRLTACSTSLCQASVSSSVHQQQQQQQFSAHLVWCDCPRRFYSTGQKRSENPKDLQGSEDASDLLWSSLEDDPLSSSNPRDTDASTVSSRSATASTEPVSGAVKGGNGEVQTSSGENEEARSTEPSEDGHDHADVRFSPSPPSYVWVALHNMPRNWMHEDIVNFIHQVAEHAGIPAPMPNSNEPSSTYENLQAKRKSNDVSREDVDGEESNGRTGAEKDAECDDDDDSMIDRVTSPFVHHLHIPFGRRTGLVYGSPKLYLSSAALAKYLTTDLTFDADDYRSRIYFTKLSPSELPRRFLQQQQQEGVELDENGQPVMTSTGGFARIRYTPVEETVEREQEEALRTLELDRYLFAPDLLLDIAKSHQRRLVTKNEKVLLDAFVDGEEDGEDDEDDVEDEDEDEEERSSSSSSRSDKRRAKQRRSTAAAEVGENEFDDDTGDGGGGGDSRRRRRASSRGGSGRRRSSKRRTRVRAGTQKHLGRGSMHNMPIPKPYVEGRQL